MAVRFVVALTVVALGACQDPPDVDGDPDYEQVFSTDVVRRIDVVMSASAWDAMMDDVTEVTGTRPGTGMMLGPDVDDAAFAACEDVEELASCSFGDERGVCLDVGETRLLCVTEEMMVGPGEVDAFTMACEGKAEGDMCAVDDEAGECVVVVGEEELFCFSDGEGMTAGEGMTGEGPTTFWPRKPRYVDCEVRAEGRTWFHVGFRAKGNFGLATSLHSLKLPFRFKFDAFEDEFPETNNQRFFGFQHLSMANHMLDPSNLRAFLTSDAYERLGVPAPAVAFYRLYIDRGEGPEYAGVYSMIEVPDDPMMNRAFGSEDGNLYKPDGGGARFASYDEGAFFKKNNEMMPDYSDVEAFVAALNRTDVSAEEWRRGLEATFDVDLFLRYLAVTRGIDNWDTYGGMPHNFYLYAHEGRLRFLPWDFDLAMASTKDAEHFALRDIAGAWPLLTRIRGDEVYMSQYLAYLRQVPEDAFDEARLADEIARLRELLSPYLVGEGGEQEPFLATSETSFRDGLAELERHVRAQNASLASFLEDAP